MGIKGGYILQPRSIDESEVKRFAPHIRELWLYLLRKANFSPQPFSDKIIKRGQLYTSYTDIIEDLSWYIGFRKKTYQKHHIETAMKRLVKAGMITTMKTTRGMIVTICKYGFYQDPKNYDNHNETYNETYNENYTIFKEGEERNNSKKKKESIPPDKEIDFRKLKTYFNSNTKGPKILKLTENRKRSIKKIVDTYGKTEVYKVLQKTFENDFLNGNNQRSWKVDFDWIFKEGNFIKIIEGRYDESNSGLNKRMPLFDDLVEKVSVGLVESNQHF